MWKKHVLLPLWAVLVSYAHALHGYDAKPTAQQGRYFIENKGQIRDQHHRIRRDLDFKLNAGKGLTIFLGSGKIAYQWATPQSTAPAIGSMPDTDHPEAVPVPATYDLYRMDVQLVGANPDARIIQEGAHPYYERYYLPSMPHEGAKGSAWQKITYQEVYPHIDWVFYFNAQGQLEHDFIVRPGGKVSDIKLQYGGATEVQLLADGSLLARTPMGTAKEHAPVAYDGSGKAIASRFNLEGNIVTFDVASYTGILTIDPILEWATYFGGPDDETGKALCTDQAGYIYLTGTTGSLSNIATTGAYQASYGGGGEVNGADAFLSKWDKEGRLIWCTYYGGSMVDVVMAISCDTADKVYLGGYTNSKDVISTTGTHQEVKAGTNTGFDCFLAQFDSTGQRIWGSYFGGTGAEGSTAVGVAADRYGHVYLTSHTGSTAGIATPGAYQMARGTGNAGFLAKFKSSGLLEWSTYYTGNSNDYPHDCTTDSAGNVYLTGYTQSTSGIATTGAYQTTPNSNQDAFICKFNPEGQLVWGTYFGGEDKDRGISISISGDRVYIVGSTNSTTGIASANTHQIQYGGVEDGLIIALDMEGKLQWSTYYGGESGEVLLSLWSDRSGEVYICGATTSKTGHTTPGAFQEEITGSSKRDMYIAKLDSSGKRLWGTYFGSLDTEYYGYITGDDDANVYISGQTNSNTGIATANAHQSTLNGISDVLLFKINDCPKPELSTGIIGPVKICDSSRQRYSIAPSNDRKHLEWILPDLWTLNRREDTAIEVFVQGEGLLQVVAINDCGASSDTLSLWVDAIPLPQPVILNHNFILSTSKSYATYQWLFEAEPIAGATKATYVATKDGYYSVIVNDGNNCEGTAKEIEISGTVSISKDPKSSFTPIYPNPAQSHVLVATPGVATLSIYTPEGRKVTSIKTTTKGTVKVPLDGLADGIYLLKIEADNQTLMFRLVKQQ